MCWILTMIFLPRTVSKDWGSGSGRTKRSALWCRNARMGGVHCAAIENCVCWIELRAARGGNRKGSAQGAGDLYEGAVRLMRGVRRPGDSEEFAEDGLGSGAGAGDREAGLV